MKKLSLFSISIILSCIIICTDSCKKDQTLIATSIEILSGNDQTAEVETSLASKIEIIVKDQNGEAFEGATVNFSVTEGSVSSKNTNTDANGKASITWTLGESEGSQTLTVSSNNSDGTSLSGSPLIVTATASPEPPIATSIELVSGDDQTGQIETAIKNPIVVIVKDQYGEAFAGTELSFTVEEGSVSDATVITDISGNASVEWTLGTTVGTQTLNVSASGLTGSPVEFSATGVECMDYDGNVYDVVTIGTQKWMSENLKVTHYSDGTEIDHITDNALWTALGGNDTDKAYCYYNNNTGGEADIYGALYTYAAATNGDNDGTTQGVCPDDWHLPSDAEWIELEMELGMSETDANNTGTRGTDEGSQLADIESLWENGILKLNENFGTSGFSALPGGTRSNLNGTFNNINQEGYFWSATQSSSTGGYARGLGFYISTIRRSGYNKGAGFSVRCIKD